MRYSLFLNVPPWQRSVLWIAWRDVHVHLDAAEPEAEAFAVSQSAAAGGALLPDDKYW